MTPTQPDCENCEYVGKDGECTAFVENPFFDPLPCEDDKYDAKNHSNRE